MIDFVQLQQIVREHLEQDREISTVEVSGPTLEAAVNEAATLLDTNIRRIEYEIIERGSSGFLGAGKKDWQIRAYEYTNARKKKKKAQKQSLSEIELQEAAIINKDGDVFAQYRSDGVYIKVTSPAGNGKRITKEDAMNVLGRREKEVSNLDDALIDNIIKEAGSLYVKIGDFAHNPINDSTAYIEVDDSEMRAYLTVNPPGAGGCDLSFDVCISLLKQNRVYYGVKEDDLINFLDKPVYKEKTEVAVGAKPVNGKDAYIQYNFETDQTKIKLQEGAGGKVDFKELNIIQNVVANQVVAKKIPPEDGIDGKTVTETILPARAGSDIPLPLGSNVHVGDSGDTVVADINGQVIMAGGLINVEPIYTVEGDVNLKTGNIIFLGTVVINGNVEDGFSVKADGNIEVKGTVSKAELDAEGDIIIHQGINGKNGGTLRAGRSIWSRFIENAKVESGNMVVVMDGIINSYVDSIKSIVCMGKRASIVGGRLRAGEEINAKVLGNPTSGTETICEVGFDPQSKTDLEHFLNIKTESEEELENIKLDLQILINTKKQRKSLPEDKEAYMRELMDRRQILIEEIKNAEGEIEKIQQHMAEMKVRGKISASTKVFPGVKIIIRDVKEDVQTEYKAVTFVLEDGLVRTVKYEEPDELAKKGLDGYSSN